MNPKIIVFLICCLLIASGAYLYYNSEPKEDLGYSNLSISAEFQNKKTITGYKIETSEGFKIGNTSQSYELATVKNEQIKISNENINNQTFYKDEKTLAVLGNQRVDLELKKPSEIIVNLKPLDNKVSINLTSKDARQVKLCLDWSFAYIFLKLEGNIQKLENNCYGTFDLKDSSEEINLTYQEFTTPSEKDFISLKLIISEFEGVLDQEIKIK